jgi:DNA-binding MarR family transcriptional regulator
MSSALHLLHRAGQCADEMFALSVGELGLTPRQFAVMTAIANSEEPSQTTLRYAVRLTDKGESALRVAEPAARTTDEKILSALAPTQRDLFIKSLSRIVLAVEPEAVARNGR